MLNLDVVSVIFSTEESSQLESAASSKNLATEMALPGLLESKKGISLQVIKYISSHAPAVAALACIYKFPVSEECFNFFNHAIAASRPFLALSNWITMKFSQLGQLFQFLREGEIQETYSVANFLEEVARQIELTHIERNNKYYDWLRHDSLDLQDSFYEDVISHLTTSTCSSQKLDFFVKKYSSSLQRLDATALATKRLELGIKKGESDSISALLRISPDVANLCVQYINKWVHLPDVLYVIGYNHLLVI